MKAFRKEGKKVNFNSEVMKKPMLDRRENEIENKIKEVVKAEGLLSDIQLQIDNQEKSIEEREQSLEVRERSIEAMAGIWKELNSLKLSEIDDNDIKNMIADQSGFVKDLLAHYLESNKKEKDLTRRINVLENNNKKLKEDLDEIIEELESKFK